MSLRSRFALLLVTVAVALLPAGTGFAAGFRITDTPSYGYFATPYSAKGRFVFITRMSRRLLRQSVALHQRPQRPMLVREEI